MSRSDNTGVRIVDWAPVYGDAFGRLNREWLEKYFRVELVDEPVLQNPERNILAAGGVILYACLGDEVVGTVALKHHGEGAYELTKMAVTEARQGRGLGRALLRAAVQKFVHCGGELLYLESNSRLKPALALYESAGFRHEKPPQHSAYARADVYMVYRGAAAANRQ